MFLFSGAILELIFSDIFFVLRSVCFVVGSTSSHGFNVVFVRLFYTFDHHGGPLPSQHRYYRRQPVQPPSTQVCSFRSVLSLVCLSAQLSSCVFKTLELYSQSYSYYCSITHKIEVLHLLKILIILCSVLGSFGLVLTHRQAAVFTARRFELFDIVQSTLTYMHPDSRVHSFLSPLPYQVCSDVSGQVYNYLILQFQCIFAFSESDRLVVNLTALSSLEIQRFIF